MSPPTGEAVRFTTQYLLTASAGRRPRVPGAVVIIADGKSVDNLTRATSSLKASGKSASGGRSVGHVYPSLTDFFTFTVLVPGVRVLAVGLGQADTGELRQAVTGDIAQNIFYVRDAAQLDSLHTGLADALCLIARTQEASGNQLTLLNCSSFLNTV